MIVLRKRGRSFTKAPFAVKLDGNHPLAYQLLAAYLFDEAGRVIDRGPFEGDGRNNFATTQSYQGSPDGRALSFNGSQAITLPNLGVTPGNSPVTMIAGILPTFTDGVLHMICSFGTFATDQAFGLSVQGTAANLVNQVGINLGGDGGNSGALDNFVGQWRQVGIMLDPGAGSGGKSMSYGLYQGRIVYSQLTLGAMNLTNSNYLLGEWLASPFYFFLGAINYLYLWNRALTSDEIAWLGEEPFVMFRSPVRRFFGGPSMTITPGAGALALTGYAPSVQTTATPGAGALALTGYAPSVAASMTVTPGTGTFTLAGYAPSLNITQTLTPGVGVLALTGYAPSAVIGSPTLTPGPAALTLTGYAPAVFPMTLTPGAGALSLTGYAPNLVLGQATPGAGALALTGYAPTIATGTAAITPGAGSLALTGYAPSLGYPPLALQWNVLQKLNAPLPLQWTVLSTFFSSYLALQWNVRATLAGLGLSWRVHPDVWTPFGISRTTGQALGGTSGDIQKPVAVVTKTP